MWFKGKRSASILVEINNKVEESVFLGVRVHYARTHHDPPRPTTTHHHPKYVHHHPLPITTIHHHPQPAKICPRPPTIIHHHHRPAKIYPPLPTISQKIDRHPAKAKIYSYIASFRHCFNSSFFFEMQYSFAWRRFCVITFILFS